MVKREANGWVTIEMNGALLVGERFGTKWQWECHSFPWLPRLFNDAIAIDRCVKEFIRLANGGARAQV